VGHGRPLDVDREAVAGGQRPRRGDEDVPLPDRLDGRRLAVDRERGDVEVDRVEGEDVERLGGRGGDRPPAAHAGGGGVPGGVELVVLDVVASGAGGRVGGVAEARERVRARRRGGGLGRLLGPVVGGRGRRRLAGERFVG